jgi:hypothetical protein
MVRALAAEDVWTSPLRIAVRNETRLPVAPAPQPARLWPGIFDQGPARPNARTFCLFKEIDDKKP